MEKPPYKITSEILNLIAAIAMKLGEVNALHIHKPKTEIRKKNRIRTIQSSLEIEGNSLSEAQITALMDNKRVVAPEKDLVEVKNAIEVYDKIGDFDPYSLSDLKKAHRILMNGLIKDAGKLRTRNVGIVQGSELKHFAPRGSMINGLMKNLMSYIRKDPDLILIKSCVFHYEFEYIHPFTDGNGRMGRLWQTCLLMKKFPVFEFLPVELLIKKNQETYYNALGKSDKMGESTPFITFMLKIILQSLENQLSSNNITHSPTDRIQLYKIKIGSDVFSRKDYLNNFKTISPATASRDLSWAVENNILKRTGDKRLTVYRFN